MKRSTILFAGILCLLYPPIAEFYKWCTIPPPAIREGSPWQMEIACTIQTERKGARCFLRNGERVADLARIESIGDGVVQATLGKGVFQ